MNVDSSKMLAEEIANSFIRYGDIFGEIKNEFNSNISAEETRAGSPVNELNTSESKTSLGGPSITDLPENKTSSFSFINVDFYSMLAEDKTSVSSPRFGDFFGETKNEFSNIFREEMEPKEANPVQDIETSETGGFLFNIFSRGREKKAEETIERGTTKINSPILSAITSAPASQENSSININTSQPAEVATPDGSVSNQTSSVSNVSNVSNDNSDQSISESMASNKSSMMQGGFDNSDMVNRLRRIERLLSGPLEVKIVES